MILFFFLLQATSTGPNMESVRGLFRIFVISSYFIFGHGQKIGRVIFYSLRYVNFFWAIVITYELDIANQKTF